MYVFNTLRKKWIFLGGIGLRRCQHTTKTCRLYFQHFLDKKYYYVLAQHSDSSNKPSRTDLLHKLKLRKGYQYDIKKEKKHCIFRSPEPNVTGYYYPLEP